jgi:hypothetical protein
MRKFLKLAVLCLFLSSVTIAAYPQEADQDFNKELDQETPQQQKQEAEKPDTKLLLGILRRLRRIPSPV